MWQVLVSFIFSALFINPFMLTVAKKDGTTLLIFLQQMSISKINLKENCQKQSSLEIFSELMLYF